MVSCDSGTVIEALYKGIQTVVVTKETDIDLNFLDLTEDHGMWAFANNAFELREKVDAFNQIEVIAVDQELQYKIFEFNVYTMVSIFSAGV